MSIVTQAQDTGPTLMSNTWKALMSYTNWFSIVRVMNDQALSEEIGNLDIPTRESYSTLS